MLEANDTVTAAHHAPFWVKKLPLLMGVLGISLAYLLYLLKPTWPEKIKKIFVLPYTLFFRKWFFDEIYDALFVKNAMRLGKGFWFSDKNIVDRFGPDGVASLSQKCAGLISRFQSGYVYQYAFVMMITVIAIVSWFIFKTNGGF